MTGISSDQLTPGAELPGADLSKRYWGAVNLDGAILANCDLSQSSFSEGYLCTGEIHTKHHMNDQLCASSFCGADLTGANLAGAHLMGCDFENADLSRACLDGADLRRSNLRNANLEFASLVGALLSEACLDGADAQAANFRGADFRACRIPEEDDNSNYFSSPKFVGVANLGPASVSGLMLSRQALDEALTNGVDLSQVIIPK
jgi:uncharacterized protein YjbI with pentapeptide repeats